MVPLIITAHSEAKTDTFIERYVKSHNISPYSIFIFEPEKKELGIDQIRSIKKLIITEPTSRRLIIIKKFDTASAEAQNALLKTLEEKTDNNQFLISVENTEKILPTITSRSRIIEVEKNAEHRKMNEFEQLFKKLVQERNFSFLGDPMLQNMDREKAKNVLDASILFLRKNLDDEPKSAQVIKRAFATKRLLESNNLNPQLSTDSFLIFWKKSLLLDNA